MDEQPKIEKTRLRPRTNTLFYKLITFFIHLNLKVMIIKSVKKGHLQHLEHYQFTDHLLSMAKEANVAKLTAVLKPLEDAFKAEDEATMTPKS